MTHTTMVALHGTGSSLVLEVGPSGAPLWRYWGAWLPPGALPEALAASRSPASFSHDVDQPLSLFPTFGQGWFGQSALLAHRDGRSFDQAFDGCEMEWVVPGACVRFSLCDTVARITVRVLLTLDAADVLRVATELVNDGTDTLDVLWMAAGVLPLPGTACTVHGTVGRHLDEFHAEIAALGRFGWRRENRRGVTSHDSFPGAIVTVPGTTEDGGLAFGAHLAWSGNHTAGIDWIDDGRFQWLVGEWLAPGEMRLAPSAGYSAPELIAVCSTAGLGGVAQGFHAEMRRRLDWPGGAMRGRPVTVNTWEGYYFDHDTERLRGLIDAAADIGAERFVLDDGWFHARNDDTSSLGDWWPDETRYPDGLGPLIAHVQARGMEFGLWVEPEMVNPDSELMRAHPDWALQSAGRGRLTARNQLVLDLSRPDVADHLFEHLHMLLSAHPIAYLKWDHNRDLSQAAGADGRARYRDQVIAAYALMARVRSAFPDVEIESCAGGGGRIDAGVLRHTHRFWISDNIDARSRLAMQRGFLRYFPPELMGAHVGTAPAHTTGRSQSLDFRAAVALPGHLGLEFDLGRLAAGDRSRLAGWIALHKRLRPVLHGGQVWQGTGQDGVLWQAHGDLGTTELVLLAYRLDPPGFRHPPPLVLPMLAQSGHWRVSRLHPDGSPPSDPPFGWPAPLAGPLLATLGLPVPRLHAEQAIVLQLQACGAPDQATR